MIMEDQKEKQSIMRQAWLAFAVPVAWCLFFLGIYAVTHYWVPLVTAALFAFIAIAVLVRMPHA